LTKITTLTLNERKSIPEFVAILVKKVMLTHRLCRLTDDWHWRQYWHRHR